MQDELLPCPFCSGSADFGTRPNERVWWSVHCDHCTAYRVGKTQAESIAMWNTRAALQPEAAPVADHPVTTNPVVDHETENMSDKLAALQAHADALAEAIRDGCEAMKVARNTIPDDDEGLAANIFAHHLNWADSTMASALRAYEAFKAGEGE